MIRVYIRCSDGPEGEWTFDALPRLNERVWLAEHGQAYGMYKVARVEHFPKPLDGPSPYPVGEDGVALRLVKVEHDEPFWETPA